MCIWGQAAPRIRRRGPPANLGLSWVGPQKEPDMLQRNTPWSWWRAKIIVVVVVLVGVAIAVPSATRPTLAMVVMVTAAVIEALTALMRLAVPRTVIE